MNKKQIDCDLYCQSAIANLLIAGLLIASITAIVVNPMLITHGLSNILAGWKLIEIQFFVFMNFLYFGGFLFLSYVLGMLFDLLYMLILEAAKIKQTKEVMLLSYVAQWLLSVSFYKICIEPLFTRVSVSWEGAAILFFCLYFSAFVISEDYKIFSDKKR
ncbi:hypothetical protein [Oceanobacillus oncorhynchi]|uniref:hypothetical protein n=1 Tax=Oceanobacillus oncorhynchi TaxID=545501 RepID=UPI002116CF2E|nr:hypothetical protein [Oceanobacillus oncorhynchi]UUI41745.1 hypothetical protein NP440_09585 [Oceanobacillus oncorhynchi]